MQFFRAKMSCLPLRAGISFVFLLLSDCFIKREQRLHDQDSRGVLVPRTRSIWTGMDNHKPFHRALRPEFYLRTLIRMLVEARIANPQQMFVVCLPLHGLFRQGMLSIFQG